MILNIFKWLTPKVSYDRFSVSSATLENIRREWQMIDINIKGKQPSQLRQALISADKTLDNALRDCVKGESMAERLKNAQSKFDRYMYNKIWEAHKVRNNLVHESGYEPPHHMLTNAIQDLRQALATLGVKV
ncbi:hypothetical protein KAZ57_03115 [Patescibacteria group bacterium]|nr:hypothetical protein [Patescibacteria group bacterium]